MKDGMYVVVSHFCEGENAEFQRTITMDQLEKIQEIIGEDFIDDLTTEHPIVIKLQTPETHRESVISGTMFGEGCSRANAERIADGLEPLEELEEV